ncbi:MAG TPA: PQQ-dependent sugar dehydrogenase [Steroidobacteraceae bacterium]|jgi:glucose/arabinose dehydrogenase|nr:PQQ-dependent sugar dehydrogenase [Steroidobacteraceae bacterium]
MTIRHVLLVAAMLCASGLAAPVSAQQKVPFAYGVPVAPTGLAHQPLGKGPFIYTTAEQQDIRVTVLLRDIEYPYAIAWLPSGEMLLTQRRGLLRIVRNGVLDPKPIEGGPASVFSGESGSIGAVHGYMNVALDPHFTDNHLLYVSYTKPLGEKRTAGAVARARLDGNRLSDVKDVFVSAEVHGALAMTVTSDGILWLATAADAEAQNPNSLGGKVLRLNLDGSVPADNPFVGKAGTRPEIYTLGHRSVLGFTQHPATHEMWISEMGPNGGDEINVLKPGRNYGWPLVSLGRTYPGPWQAKVNEPTHAGFEPPIIYWMPSISVTGLTFYTGDRLPKWKGDLFVAGVRYGEIPGTGRLDRVLLNANMEELRRETLLADLHQRIRDVKQGPDGLLYVATDEPKGAILRIEPAQ